MARSRAPDSAGKPEAIVTDAGRTRRAAIFFVLIAFGVPWVCWTILAFGGGERGSTLRWALFFSGDACSVAGIVATGIALGRAGVRDLLRRSIQVRAPLVAWLIALVLPIAWRFASRVGVALATGQVGPVELAGFASLVEPPVLFLWTTGPLGEELGWRGYLLPRLMEGRLPLAATLWLGLIWAGWHLPLYAPRWAAQPWRVLTFTAAVLAFSLLLTVVYQRSRASVFLCIVGHWALNASEPVVDAVLPAATTEGDIPFAIAELAVLWAVTVPVWLWTQRPRPSPALPDPPIPIY
jgi:uncharacterized protein